MKRTEFLQKSSFLSAAAAIGLPFNQAYIDKAKPHKKAKNIIFLVSDGMSIGTLNMTDIFLQRKEGRGTHWLNLYRENKVKRALMDTASASSIVTDSAAASSAWGGGVRVANGALNVGANGETYLPIWQKMKNVGKSVGCVTTVPITHATPAGFCVNSKSRRGQSEIAEMYLKLRFDVMMGGGEEYFSPEKREDKKDMFAAFKNANFQVARQKSDLAKLNNTQPILGVFYENGLPYSVDRNSSKELQERVPTLAEMTQTAINAMKNNPKGFVLQVEAGKVDWAAHANDIAAIIHDQLAFDDAIKVALDFADSNQETLVIITTDHGNANPGIIYGDKANQQFDSIQQYKQSNEWILNGINKNSTTSEVITRIAEAQSVIIKEVDAKMLLLNYLRLDEEELYNPRHLPFRRLAQLQSKTNSVGWISMDHSADFVELAAYGAGSELLPAFVKNTDLHQLMLAATEVKG
jgi:alkaline phosphatase